MNLAGDVQEGPICLQADEPVGSAVRCMYAGCERVFKNKGGLARHQSAKHVVALHAPPLVRKLRKAHSVRFKANAVAMLRTSLLLICLKCGRGCPSESTDTSCSACGGECKRIHKNQHEVAEKLGVNPSLLSKWNKQTDRLYAQDKAIGRMRKVHRGPRRKYHDEEQALYMSFINMRVNLGLSVDHYWLRNEMWSILSHTRGEEHKANLCNGWLKRFCRYYRISDQMKTEKKYKSAVERAATIDQFHVDLMHLQRTMPQTDPTWGAYAPTNIWNADHVPLPFIVNFKRSLNPVGEDCWIAQMGASGLDKRQATIHLWYANFFLRSSVNTTFRQYSRGRRTSYGTLDHLSW